MKTSKTLITFLAIALFSINSVTAQNWWGWGKGIKGEGKVVKKTVELDKFTSIGLAIAADVIVTQGNSQEVTIHAQQNILDNIKTEVRNGNWEITYKENVKEADRVIVYITMKKLDGAYISGSGKIKGTNVFDRSDDLEFAVSGSGDIELEVETSDIQSAISGSGDIILSGNANTQEVAISGSGGISAYDLKTDKASISISGSGQCKVNVSSSLEVSIAGSGDVYYKGNPAKLDSSIVGSGDVVAKE